MRTFEESFPLQRFFGGPICGRPKKPIKTCVDVVSFWAPLVLTGNSSLHYVFPICLGILLHKHLQLIPPASLKKSKKFVHGKRFYRPYQLSENPFWSPGIFVLPMLVKFLVITPFLSFAPFFFWLVNNYSNVFLTSLWGGRIPFIQLIYKSKINPPDLLKLFLAQFSKLKSSFRQIPQPPIWLASAKMVLFAALADPAIAGVTHRRCFSGSRRFFRPIFFATDFRNAQC